MPQMALIRASGAALCQCARDLQKGQELSVEHLKMPRGLVNRSRVCACLCISSVDNFSQGQHVLCQRRLAAAAARPALRPRPPSRQCRRYTGLFWMKFVMAMATAVVIANAEKYLTTTAQLTAISLSVTPSPPPCRYTCLDHCPHDLL
jgi:hypothetical protein